MKKHLMKGTSAIMVVACLFFFACGDSEMLPPHKGPAYVNLQMEKLDRGLVAIHQGAGDVFLSWRYLKDDSPTCTFNVYRSCDGADFEKINPEPMRDVTYFIDRGIDSLVENRYYVRPVVYGWEKEPSKAYVLTPERARVPYISIPVPQLEGDEKWTYEPNDASVADVDGDGEYEIILKRDTGGYACSQPGAAYGTTKIEVYKMDGRLLWSVDLGLNIRQGAQYTHIIAYDYDGDGRAEIAVRTSEGTIFGDGQQIGDTDGDGRTVYIDTVKTNRTYGKILEGPEFLSVIDGVSGRELARVDYVERGKKETWNDTWGDDWGNRMDRMLIGVAYLDGARPSIVACRGYNGATVIDAWDYRDGSLTKRWRFNTHDGVGNNIDYADQGNHQIRIGDVEGDGKDEILYGACVIDDNGKGLYSTGLRHGDAIHFTDIDIDRPGLEIWQGHEYPPNGSSLRDAATGEILLHYTSKEDVGRAMCADIDPRFRGCEFWAGNTGGIRSAKGEVVSERMPSLNMAIWWDGDLARELLDGVSVHRPDVPRGEKGKPTPEGAKILSAFAKEHPHDGGVAVTKWNGYGVDSLPLPRGSEIITNNGSKQNPCLVADFLGDWREDLIVRTKDNKEMRIYISTIPTPYRFYSFMQDPIYRLCVATQNAGYNQPNNPGFYLGTDLEKPFALVQGADNGAPVEIREEKYMLEAGYDYDSYLWKVGGRVVQSQGRTLELKANKYGCDKPQEIVLEASFRGFVFSDSLSVVFKK